MNMKLKIGNRVKIKNSDLIGTIVYQKHMNYGILLDNEKRSATIAGQPAATYEYLKKQLEIIVNNS